MMNDRRTWLSTEEAAIYLGFAPKTLQNWRSDGTGPNYHVLRNRCFYRLEDLHDFQDKKAKRVETVYFATMADPAEIAALLAY